MRVSCSSGLAINGGWLIYARIKKQIKVFSCFSCGGGSTMGYKRAGFDVLGNVEIDAGINAVYVKNHHPRFNYNLDLRDFNRLENLPAESAAAGIKI